MMRISPTSLVVLLLVLVTGAAAAQTLRLDRDGGFSFRFGRDDRRGDVEGKRASCEVYARIAVVQADANARFRCGLRGPAWVSIRRRTSAGAGSCRVAALPRSSAAAPMSCSAVSTGSAISTTTTVGRR